jgi:hypothetical protein
MAHGPPIEVEANLLEHVSSILTFTARMLEQDYWRVPGGEEPYEAMVASRLKEDAELARGFVTS